jgi:isocitrate/isopropylmalate dehydrogenase
MMLDHAGLAAEAERLEAAVARVYRVGKHLTADQGGNGTTTGFVSAVLDALKNG